MSDEVSEKMSAVVWDHPFNEVLAIACLLYFLIIILNIMLTVHVFLGNYIFEYWKDVDAVLELSNTQLPPEATDNV